MIDFVNEPVSVEGEVRQDGTTRPRAFVWRGRRYRIRSWGRERRETHDNRSFHYYLVQTAGVDTWELCLEIETAQWTLVRRWARGPRVV